MKQSVHPWLSVIAVKVGLNPRVIGKSFNIWPVAAIQDRLVLLNLASLQSVDFIWRSAHRDEECTRFAEPALRPISCGRSESDAERVLSMEKNIAGFHGTKFAIRPMESRSKAQIAFFSLAVPTHYDGIFMGSGNDKTRIDLDTGSESESSGAADDLDTKDF
jgi:hypothetical protein